MKKILKEILVTATLAFILINIISYYKRPQPSFDTLPAMTIPLVNGGEFKSNTLDGKPIMIHFWATWCPTCKVEISNFNAIAKDHQVVTIAVQSGNDETLQSYMKEKGLDFALINDRNGILAKKFSIEAYPTTMIFDKDGKIAFSSAGYCSTLGLKARLWWLGLK